MDKERRSKTLVALIALGVFAFIWWLACYGAPLHGGVTTLDRVPIVYDRDKLADSVTITDSTLTLHGDVYKVVGAGTLFGVMDSVMVIDSDSSSPGSVYLWFAGAVGAGEAGLWWNGDSVMVSTNGGTNWYNVLDGGGAGAAWNWEDSSGQAPFWVDSATYATAAGSVGGETDPTLIDDGLVTVGDGTKSEDTLIFDVSGADAKLYYNGVDEYFLTSKNLYSSGRIRAGTGGTYDVRAAFYSDIDGGGPVLLGANSADSAGVTWGSLTALSYGTKANIHDSLGANWATFIADENDTVTSYRAAAHDTLWANSPGYLTDSTAGDVDTTGTQIAAMKGNIYNDLANTGAEVDTSEITDAQFNQYVINRIDVKVSDSTAASATLADSANGGAIRAETSKLSDSTKTIRINTIDSTHIVAGGIGYGDLHANSVVSGHVLDGSLIGDDVADASVLEADLGIENSPTDEYVLVYDSDNGGMLTMEWRQVAPRVDTAYGALRHLAVDAVRDSGFLEELNVEDSAHVLDDYFLNEEGDTCTGDLRVEGLINVDSVGADFTYPLIVNASGAYVGTDDDSSQLQPRDSVTRIAATTAHDTLWAWMADTVVTALAAEYAGMVLFQSLDSDSLTAPDSVILRGHADADGNYIEALDSLGNKARHKRHIQIAIPVPLDVDSLRYIKLYSQVFAGTGTESTYVVAQYALSSFDSSGTWKLAYKDKDSSNAVTLTAITLETASAVTPGSGKVYLLVTYASADGHDTWARSYDLLAVWHRRSY